MSNFNDLKESPKPNTPESEIEPSFTRYNLQRGSGKLKPVRRCSSSFSRFEHGKIGAKLVEYISSDEEKDEGKKMFVEKRDVLVHPESPLGSSTNPQKAPQKELMVVFDVPSSPEEVTRVFPETPSARATPGSGSGRKRARSDRFQYVGP